MTGWTMVTRNKRQKRRTVQIGSKATPMEVSLMDDKVDDVMGQIPNGEDVRCTGER